MRIVSPRPPIGRPPLPASRWSRLRTIGTVAVGLLLVSVWPRAAVPAADSKAIDFDSQIAPLLAAHCLECHGQGAPQGGLSLLQSATAMQGGDSGVAILAGNAADSELWLRVDSDDMPPKHPLGEAEKTLLKTWIDQGARWGTSPIDPFATTTDTRAGRDWWALQPLRDVAPPGLSNDAGRHPIDAFVARRLRNQSPPLSLQAQADPRTLLRRLYFDLIGLPPTPEQVRAFAADPSPAAYQRHVDQLLASPAYGERWARHWLDVVRFGESDGFERNMPRENAWMYRDWVIDAFNADMPYDQFVRQQLIGDQLVGGVRGAAATGFWVAGVHNTVVGGSERMKQLARQDEIEEVLATIGQSFLGLTINCARCHDHKFDPISQTEFYQLASAISGLGYGEREVQDAQQTAALRQLDAKRQQLSERLSDIDAAARAALLAGSRHPADASVGPSPYAVWEFDDNARDVAGRLHGTLQGTAKLQDGALVLDGGGYMETAPLPHDVADKTLEVWVQLDDLQQRGGGAISIESRDGVTFDSIVFGEREPQRWMAGSNHFARTESFAATAEDAALGRPVHIALVYSADGTIRGYRDGQAYGQPIRKAPLQPFASGESEFLFGLRHKPFSESRALRGRIFRAAFYDAALTPAEVAASATRSTEYVSEQQIVDSLAEPQRAQRQAFKLQLETLNAQRESLAAQATRKLYTLTATSGANTHVLFRGDPDNVGPLVAPAAVAAVQGVSADFGLSPDAPEAERRRKLADWITAFDNPLFARVIVNRVWHYHFGNGIVDTPNDFGFNGGRPSHPELLDYLATRFRREGFRLKDLHRLIVTSQTYRQASRSESAAIQQRGQAQDAANRLLWHGPTRRLEAEAIRDAMLRVAGQLNQHRGGKSFKDVSVDYINGTTYYEPLDVDGEAFFRRTVYRFNPRGGRSALLDTFDCPDSASTAPRRAVTTTPLQALSLLNNAFVLRMADYFANRVQAEVGKDISLQVQRTWQLALARQPTPQEAELSQQLVQQHGLSALCRGLFNSNEFVIID